MVAAESTDADAADVDGDGDTDVFVTRTMTDPNYYLVNVTQVPDTTAPRIPLVEQAPGRSASSTTTVVRAHVLDNAPYYVTWYAPTVLEFRVESGVWRTAPMVSVGGQVFRGEIPGELTGQISYRVRSTDSTGNVGLSTTLVYTATGTCGGNLTSYCTAGTSASGCQATLSATGVPSPTSGSGFSVSASQVEGEKDGVFFYGFTGGQANSWGNGTSFQCVVPPVKRAGLMAGSGTAGLCDGSFTMDFNAYWATANAPKVPASGQGIVPAALVSRPVQHEQPDHELLGRVAVHRLSVAGCP